jgi:hypothetical protein
MEDLTSLDLQPIASLADCGEASSLSPRPSLQGLSGPASNSSGQLLSVDTIGNTQATGTRITLSSTAATYQETIGGGDTWDFYRFTLGSQGIVNFSLYGLSQAAYLYLYDSSNRIVAYDLSSGSSNKQITREVIAGTYYLAVGSSATVETSYSLRAGLDALSGPWSTLSGYGPDQRSSSRSTGHQQCALC